MDIQMTTNDDGFLAKAGGVQGGFAEGNTPLEALSNLLDVLQMINSYKNNTFSREKISQGINFQIPTFA